MSLRKKALVFAFVALVALMVPSVALANYAIHGNYVDDTDACAGCHRAHTSVSTITWQDNAGDMNSALLVSSATSIQEFCYACHDGNSLGADTDVQDGVYLGSTNGVTGGVLNGGGFETIAGSPVTSWHVTNSGSPVVKWGAWGGGYFTRSAVNTDTNGLPAADDPYTAEVGDARSTGQSTAIKMDCTTCHDPHGSSNYRILKSMVLGNYVGGYQASGDSEDPNPDGFVSSVETGWPIAGFRLHTAYPAYQPNYTTAMYSKGYDMEPLAIEEFNGAPISDPTIDANKGMSGWCVGCHSVYMTKESTYNAGDDYGNGLGIGLLNRHRHPINVPLSNYDGPDKTSMIVTDLVLPLAHEPATETGNPLNRSGDWIECLTCHRAHGTAAVMTGWANELSAAIGDEVPDFISRQSLDPDGDGVVYSEASNLLRYNNRGVCERCHNK